MTITFKEILTILTIALVIGYCINFWAYIAAIWAWGAFRFWRYKKRQARFIARVMGD